MAIFSKRRVFFTDPLMNNLFKIRVRGDGWIAPSKYTVSPHPELVPLMLKRHTTTTHYCVSYQVYVGSIIK